MKLSRCHIHVSTFFLLRFRNTIHKNSFLETKFLLHNGVVEEQIFLEIFTLYFSTSSKKKNDKNRMIIRMKIFFLFCLFVPNIPSYRNDVNDPERGQKTNGN